MWRQGKEQEPGAVSGVALALSLVLNWSKVFQDFSQVEVHFLYFHSAAIEITPLALSLPPHCGVWTHRCQPHAQPSDNAACLAWNLAGTSNLYFKKGDFLKRFERMTQHKEHISRSMLTYQAVVFVINLKLLHDMLVGLLIAEMKASIAQGR